MANEENLIPFQSTPLREGRQEAYLFGRRILLISIHTPIRGRQAVILFGQQSDSSRKPHRKGVLLPVLTQLQQSIQRFQAAG